MGVRGPAGMPTLSRKSKIAIGVGVAILVVLLVGPRLVSIITDWLWMSDVGYTEVFSTIVWTRIASSFVGSFGIDQKSLLRKNVPGSDT